MSDRFNLCEARRRMAESLGWIGEPAVELPAERVLVRRDPEGGFTLIIGMQDLIDFVDRVCGARPVQEEER